MMHSVLKVTKNVSPKMILLKVGKNALHSSDEFGAKIQIFRFARNVQIGQFFFKMRL